MIDEKHSRYISILSMGLAIIFIVVLVFIKPSIAANKGIGSNISTVLDKDAVTEINIDIDEEDWDWLIENAINEEYRSANITINGQTYYNVGIRPKGNTTLTQVASDPTTDRFSFKIDFDQYIDNQTYNGIESIVLNNIMFDKTYMKEYLSYEMFDFLEVATPEYSYSNIKVNNEDWGLYLAIEVVDERLIEKELGSIGGNLYKPESMGVGGGGAGNLPNGNMQKPVFEENKNNQQIKEIPNEDMPPVSGASVTIPEGSQGESDVTGNNPKKPIEPQANNEPNQMPGRDFEGAANPGKGGFGKNSGGSDLVYNGDELENYSTIAEGAVYKDTDDKDLEKVVEMIKNLNEGTNLEDYLDVENILKYFAVNTFLVNLDSYSGGMYHNYYLYENNGKFTIIPWDLNLSFGAHNVKSAEEAINFPIDSPVTGTLENSPLIGKLLEVEEYKEMYHSYLEKIVNEYISSGVFNERVNKVYNLIDDYVKMDKTAFYTYEEFKSSIPEILIFAEDRATSIEEQMLGNQPSETYGNISTTLNLEALGTMNMGNKGNGNDKSEFGNLNNNKVEPLNMNNMKPDNIDLGNMKPDNIGLGNIKNYSVKMFIFIVITILGLLFSYKFKRKKY